MESLLTMTFLYREAYKAVVGRFSTNNLKLILFLPRSSTTYIIEFKPFRSASTALVTALKTQSSGTKRKIGGKLFRQKLLTRKFSSQTREIEKLKNRRPVFYIRKLQNSDFLQIYVLIC